MLTALVIVGVAGVVVAAHERTANVRLVALALVEALSRPGLRAELLRSSDPMRRDVILLPREATAATLAAVLMRYGQSASVAVPSSKAFTRIPVTDLPHESTLDSRIRARAARMLAKVRRERPSQIGRYGRGRWTTIRVRVST